ncbi:hypothetical protein [Erwinia tasmaniensis]|uniref:hypothetical protein n=1 Tax=Erwinia tasmaniensis TaxID=338565 RepID=UPI000310A79A|nr:hypothetical protein [Erwinia tasmaniensis]
MTSLKMDNVPAEICTIKPDSGGKIAELDAEAGRTLAISENSILFTQRFFLNS